MATTVASTASAVGKPMTREEKKVIFASSLGTVFEWYDFYLYGTLAAIIGKQFFSNLDPGSQVIFSLLAFAASHSRVLSARCRNPGIAISSRSHRATVLRLTLSLLASPC